MNPSHSFERYRKAMDLIVAKCIDSAADSIINGTVSDPAVSAAASVLLDGFREIESTLKTLSLIETMVRVAAPRSRSISKFEYLKFLIGAHLQELYILEQRLTTYAKKVSRAYKTRIDEAPLVQSVLDTFDNLIKTRGEHVHVRRLEDKRIDLLRGAAFVEHLVEGIRIDTARKYKTIQAEWHASIKRNNVIAREFLEGYFECLLVGITQDGFLILPRTGKGHQPPAIKLDDETKHPRDELL